MEEKLEKFKSLHGEQLERMGVPEILYPSISSQLDTLFASSSNDNETNKNHLWESSTKCYNQVISSSTSSSSSYPLEVIVTPHIVSFNIHNQPSNGLHEALSKLSTPVLIRLREALYDSLQIKHGSKTSVNEDVINDISRHAWDRLILYKDTDNNVIAALPYPPYTPYLTNKNIQDESTSTLMGPFPFAYVLQNKMSFCSISFVEKNEYCDKVVDPRIDPVPDYMCPSPLIKNTRMASILNNYCHFYQTPPPDYEKAVKAIKMHYGDFVHKLHLVRQSKEEGKIQSKSSTPLSITKDSFTEPLIVYIEKDDPMQLSHPEAGLTDPRFQVIHSMPNDNGKIDVIYSFSSLFAPNSPFSNLLSNSNENTSPILINQFPYEGRSNKFMCLKYENSAMNLHFFWMTM